MPVDARRMLRKIRGGSPAHLLEAADSHHYVVKFQNNPQHRRILINEWISAAFLSYLGLSCPAVAIARVTEEFLADNPDVYMQLGSRRFSPVPGWHFGLRFPGDPARMAAYDFFPDALLASVENLSEFLGVLAFDKWIGNADARQANLLPRPAAEDHGRGDRSPQGPRRLGLSDKWWTMVMYSKGRTGG